MKVTVRYNSQPDSDSERDLDRELVSNLSLKIREMLPERPNRWAYALFDNRDGGCFESTFPFESPEQAAQSGLTRLEELKRRATDGTKRLVIVSPEDSELLANLKRLLAGNQRMQVLVDRRKPLASMGKRIPDRRTMPVSEEALARGWWIVPGDSARSA